MAGEYNAYHVQLAWEWLQAQPRAERTPSRVQSIAAHIGQSYGLDAEAIDAVHTAVCDKLAKFERSETPCN